MRHHKSFRSWLVLTAVSTAAALSVFGATPVRAQTSATTVSSSGIVLPPGAPVAQGPVRRLSIDEAVAMALEQNLDLQVERINPQLQDYSISVARSGWTPNFVSSVFTRSQTNPPQDIFSGTAATITNDTTFTNVGVNQLLPFGGASYSANWNSGRITTNNDFSPFNPQLSSSIAFNYTQPLLRNFKIDATRQQLLVSRKNREISDVQLNESIAITSRNVKNAYWDLVYTIDNLTVQRQSLVLAQTSFRNNRARVEIGTMAPIDIIEAEAEVARREEGVILAEAAISRAEDRLRALISNPSQPDFWTMRLEPTDPAVFTPVAVDVEAAVNAALDRRTDLASSRKQIEANDISIRYFRNQSMPDVNALVNYSAIGLAGTRFDFNPGFPPTVRNTSQRGFFGALGDVFASDFPTWSLQLQVTYPIGASNAEVNHARARLQNQQAAQQLESQKMIVATQIRDLARSVTTNAKRVEATRASRALAEKRLEAEEKKFTAGMTEPFFVLQAQRDLNQARNNELQALIDYLKSIVDYQTAQEAPLGGGGGVTVVTGGGGGGGPIR